MIFKEDVKAWPTSWPASSLIFGGSVMKFGREGWTGGIFFDKNLFGGLIFTKNIG